MSIAAALRRDEALRHALAQIPPSAVADDPTVAAARAAVEAAEKAYFEACAAIPAPDIADALDRLAAMRSEIETREARLGELGYEAPLAGDLMGERVADERSALQRLHYQAEAAASAISTYQARQARLAQVANVPARKLQNARDELEAAILHAREERAAKLVRR